MSNLIGYARVSTTDQDPQLQLDALTTAGCVRIFTESASGVKTSRPELDAALNYLREGDQLVVWRLDRLGRSLPHLLDVLAQLDGRGVGFRSLTESLDTSTSGGRLVFCVFGAIAQFERELITERTRAGLVAAKAQGRVGGRPRTMTEANVAYARDQRTGGASWNDIAASLRVSRSTVQRALTS
jgi:DNA invertase Pin-like site-specific DNA recombinase